jgi:transcription initiation factor TFIIH subunit 1
MSSIKAAVSYKKKDGHLTISQDVKYLFFTPSTPAGASPSVTVPVADITNLQQTPATSPKIALKVVLKDDSHVFSFTHKNNARQEQETVTDTLRNTIAAAKAAPVAQPASAPAPGTSAQNGDTGQPAALAMAKVANAKTADDGWYDDNKLKYDFQMQESLLKADNALNARFRQAREDKPESVSAAQFNTQFWSSRLHLLRAHAIEKQQKMGEYNVLPEIRFTRKAGEKDGDPDIKQLHITKEQIKLIFKQYPLVREAYNENVPKPLRDVEFWTRFFGSRLLKQLKGEKISQQVDPPDSILDNYLDRTTSGPASISHIPHFIDLEGNEQDHSQRKGNRPDETMRPSANNKVPILQVLNNLSEKMLSHVAAADGEAHAPIGIDEETFQQLRLRDLAMDDVDNRVVLNVREQQRTLAGERQENASKEAALYAKQDPVQVLSLLQTQLRPSKETSSLEQAIGFDPDSDSEDDDEAHSNGASNLHVGAKSALNTASTAVLSSIAQQRASASSDPQNLLGLSQDTFTTLTTTHNTTTEFLHYFWTLFLSGDPARSTELAQLISTLDKSLDRIKAVSVAAKAEREKYIEGIKKRMAEQQKRTGKKARYDFDAVGGGSRVVDAMIRPTVGALAVATAAYKKAFEKQSREAAAAVV